MPSLWESPRRDSPRLSTRMVRPQPHPLEGCEHASKNQHATWKWLLEEKSRCKKNHYCQLPCWLLEAYSINQTPLQCKIKANYHQQMSASSILNRNHQFPACDVNADRSPGQKYQVIVLCRLIEEDFPRKEDPAQHAIAEVLDGTSIFGSDLMSRPAKVWYFAKKKLDKCNGSNGSVLPSSFGQTRKQRHLQHPLRGQQMHMRWLRQIRVQQLFVCWVFLQDGHQIVTADLTNHTWAPRSMRKRRVWDTKKHGLQPPKPDKCKLHGRKRMQCDSTL